ncbi:MAG: hypothetical protein CVU38_01535 [Chloroflexi bacterium HGW-Chloroflexi-1]|nr:MAG: hypothetical protein CVU38_01535 [Chloroflexi bacterium HGW-Chloroflexi-1]
MTSIEQALHILRNWWDALPTYKQNNNLPARGTLAGALVVLERLQESCDLDISNHTVAGGVQIKGTSGQAVRKLLARYGETRPFLAEGGRTNMGLRADIKALLNQLAKTDLARLPLDERSVVLGELQKSLVAKMQEYPTRPGLKVKYDPTASVAASVRGWLDLARQHGKEEAVTHHLVGAKLQLRFPELTIGAKSVRTTDQQLDKAGDFLVGDTVFHVTVAPVQPIYDKCKQNLYDGLRVYLLVPDERVSGARMLAEMNGIKHSINIRAIEVFVADNIAELSTFASDQLSHGFLRLLDEYNRRVEIAEIDKSLLIEIPANLQRLRQETPGA